MSEYGEVTGNPPFGLQRARADEPWKNNERISTSLFYSSFQAYLPLVQRLMTAGSEGADAISGGVINRVPALCVCCPALRRRHR